MEAKQSQQCMEECKVPRKTWLEQKLGPNRFHIAVSISSMTSKCERNKPNHCRQFVEAEELDTIENVQYDCSCFQNQRELEAILTNPLDVLGFIKGLT